MIQELLLKIEAYLPSPFKWLKEVMSHSGVASSKRLVLVFSAACLWACLLVFTGTIAYILIKHPTDHKIDGNIVLLYTSLTAPIAILAGAVYVGKKEIPEDTTNPTPMSPKPIKQPKVLQG